MICEKLTNGQDSTCNLESVRYYQQAVIINRSDINQKTIQTSYKNIEGLNFCRHKVFFDLFLNKKGFKFQITENANSIFGTFSKTTKDGIVQYSHSVNVPVFGNNESLKCLLKQLDKGDFFIALQTNNGIVEVFGFEFGLSSSDYTYDPHNKGGGEILIFKSLSDALEDEPPFIYGGNSNDFNIDFLNVDFAPLGDFNNDFDDDFNI